MVWFAKRWQGDSFVTLLELHVAVIQRSTLLWIWIWTSLFHIWKVEKNSAGVIEWSGMRGVDRDVSRHIPTYFLVGSAYTHFEIASDVHHSSVCCKLSSAVRVVWSYCWCKPNISRFCCFLKKPLNNKIVGDFNCKEFIRHEMCLTPNYWSFVRATLNHTSGGGSSTGRNSHSEIFRWGAAASRRLKTHL